ncbi:long-chain-fatty-acid--CoA ligase [Haloechinothrix halophila]|uniref:long-chain-fatty-acid--CoA ligase n=1 Tax=Haloechinothrix halophila TaxID=1069073 RepID=UPI0003FAB4EA|nr:long-chain fatty acid--CoA ligase [Haloechinothrix halophila]
MNITDNLVQTAKSHGDRVALKLDDIELTYALLEASTRKVAGLLREHGVEPGDRVGVMLPNVPHFAALFYGILRAGAVVVPMNPLLKEREVAYYLGNSGAKVLFVWELFAAEAEPGARIAGAETIVVDPVEFMAKVMAAQSVDEVVERADDDTAVILYTSGTTGQPKGAELTHANLDRNIEICVDDIQHLTENDVMFGGLPLFHVFGQTCGLNACVKVGACLTLLPKFDPAKALEVLQRDKVTVFGGVPTMYVALVNHPERDSYDLSSLRLCVSGGAAMPVEVMNAFEAAFGCVVLEGYGLSETSPVASFNFPDNRRAGSIGTPVNGVEFTIVDGDGNEVADGEVGEIAIKGHNIMKGYWAKPEETAKAIADGWFHTGDMGRKDAEGFYFIVDRKKEMIIRGGYNVYPREIEEVLYEHPAVGEAAVIGVPHDELGEEIAAVVAVKPGAETSAEELREYVKAKVAAYKYPRMVRLVDELPKGPTGKILKREIKLTGAPA